nr:MAG TPA: hypothetical protein [Caudoviricetes sp.]
MIEITNIIAPSPEQIKATIMGMRNPKNSWDRSDTVVSDNGQKIVIGKNDLKLMDTLVAGGSVHAKFRRMLNVIMDINAPLYFWKELDTYKVGTVRNSCSTMHKIADKEFTLKDFSYEHLTVESITFGLEPVIDILNKNRKLYLMWKGVDKEKESLWWQMIQLLPSSYNQKSTVSITYEALANMYKWRNNHKLDEWRVFCEKLKELPLSGLITRS